MKTIILAVPVCLLSVSLSADSYPAELNFTPVATLMGVAKAKSGYEVAFGEVEVRLRGIEAPRNHGKHKTESGAASAANLASLMEGSDGITCFLDGTRAERKPVAVCFLGPGSDNHSRDQDLGFLQVKAGQALDCQKFSGGMYKDAEAEAKANGLDLSTTYTRPKVCAGT